MDSKEFLRRHQRQVAAALELGPHTVSELASRLFVRATDEKNLKQAWDHLVANGGHASGPDNVTYSDIPDHYLWSYLRGLRDDARSGNYEPGPERVIHISKGPGRGIRPLAIQCCDDRVLQRAVVQVVQPLVDPVFDDLSFGFRPRRSVLDALAAAESLTLDEGFAVWLAEDFRDAFSRVPIGRLLPVVRKYLPADDIVELIRRIMANASTRGLRQGGSLSPLLLNLYLHHHLDGPWRKAHPETPLLRYADDILLLCRSKHAARHIYADLDALLRPCGMLLRGNLEEAICDLSPARPAEWLGFRISRDEFRLGFDVADGAWSSLQEAFTLIGGDPHANDRAGDIVRGWLGQMGPAYRRTDIRKAHRRMQDVAQGLPIPTSKTVKEIWQRAYARWGRVRRRWRRCS